jgi:SRSO17 transposase
MIMSAAALAMIMFVKTEHRGAAAAAIVEGQRAASNLAKLHVLLEPCFARVEPFVQAGKYMKALIGDVPRKNGWQISEYVGDATPDRTQRLLNHAAWDHEHAMGLVRGAAVDEFADLPLRVAAFDESGQEKTGDATAGAKRQYMGCAGRIANGVNIVYCSYATRIGHCLVDGRIYLPKDQLDDPGRRRALGIPDDVVFKTKPDLAIDITTDMLADATMPGWAAGDEVYGRCGKLRSHFEHNDIGYVLRVGKAFHVELAKGLKLRADEAVNKYLTARRCWRIDGVAGSKGQRRYTWAWLATRSPRHFLLIRKHLRTGELAYHYCYIPPEEPISMATLIAVACLRWPVEEDFEFGKDYFGLDHSQVRLYTALARHIVLTMAALTVCAVTAAQAKKNAPPPVLPTSPDEDPPDDIGLIAFTVNEIRRVFNLLHRQTHHVAHHLHWSRWRRRHQARARWFHHRTRLRRQDATR